MGFLSQTFSGVIGDDPFGTQIRAGLKAEGIDLQGLLVRKGLESQFAFIAAEPGLARRTIFCQRPTGSPPGPEELDFDLIRRPAYPVEAVDTTGCGDVFHAGFIYGLIKGWTADQSLDWGPGPLPG
jgi:sugar/nucleoside kinase (ribokinase family)